MRLAASTRVGPYEITAQIGAAGMGEVYRATDTRLKRDVALKILPESFAADAERLARFQREAEVLASLNHLNIAHIHGLEESGSVHAPVMELVEGEDLSERIARGPIPLDEALPIARQIAEALEAAHEACCSTPSRRMRREARREKVERRHLAALHTCLAVGVKLARWIRILR